LRGAQAGTVRVRGKKRKMGRPGARYLEKVTNKINKKTNEGLEKKKGGNQGERRKNWKSIAFMGKED